MKKLLLVTILFAAVSAACSAPGAISPTLRASSAASLPVIQIEYPTASVLPSLVAATASSTNTAEPQADKALDPSVESLLALIAASDAQTDIAWIRENFPFPTVIKDYGNSEAIMAKYIKPKMVHMLAFVRPVDFSHIELDDVKWISSNNDAGYDIINESKGYKRYTLTKDAMVFVDFYGTDIAYSVPIDSLPEQIAHKGNNLFTVYFEGSKIKLIFEHYVA